MTNHIYFEREDDLLHCKVCGGGEGELTTDCCGYKLDADKRDEIYINGLDFDKNKGWFYRPVVGGHVP